MSGLMLRDSDLVSLFKQCESLEDSVNMLMSKIRVFRGLFANRMPLSQDMINDWYKMADDIEKELPSSVSQIEKLKHELKYCVEHCLVPFESGRIDFN